VQQGGKMAVASPRPQAVDGRWAKLEGSVDRCETREEENIV
jgi:hypothetical protein